MSSIGGGISASAAQIDPGLVSPQFNKLRRRQRRFAEYPAVQVLQKSQSDALESEDDDAIVVM
jgi:hypothetical protein